MVLYNIKKITMKKTIKEIVVSNPQLNIKKVKLFGSYANDTADEKSPYFFPAPDGGFYDTSTIYDIFRKCLFDAGIPHRGRGKGPRLHDLRHSFAVHILNKWSSEGKDIYTCLPILRTALGHDRITTTEKYLRLVPEAYMEVTEPFNDRFHTITEVLCNEE